MGGVEHQEVRLSTAAEFEYNQGDLRSKRTVSFKENFKNPEFRRKFYRTVWFGVAFWGLGYSIGQRGPAFLDIQLITGTDVEQASFFYTASAIGYLIGAFITGVIYDRLNKTVLLLLCMLGMAVATTVVPWCAPYGAMIFIHFTFSVFGSGLDTASNADLVRLWGKEGEVPMQCVHFAYAFGGVIGPLVIEPFLAKSPQDPLQLSTPASSDSFNSTTTSFSASVPAFNASSPSFNSSIPPALSNETGNSTSSLPGATNIHVAFAIAGGLLLAITVPLVVLLFMDTAQKRRQERADEKKGDEQQLPRPLFVCLLVLMCVLYFLYCAVEDTFAAYLSTFVVIQLGWSKSRGAQVTAVFWALFATGRFLSIFVVHFLNSVKTLLVSLACLAGSMLGFLLVSHYNIDIGVWIFAGLGGVAMAPVFPAGFSWMEEEFFHVSSKVTAAIFIASSAGAMIDPILLGFLMQKLTPMWFSYLMAVEALLSFTLFLVLLVVSRLYLRKHYVIHESKVLEIVVPASRANDKATAADSKI